MTHPSPAAEPPIPPWPREERSEAEQLVGMVRHHQELIEEAAYDDQLRHAHHGALDLLHSSHPAYHEFRQDAETLAALRTRLQERIAKETHQYELLRKRLYIRLGMPVLELAEQLYRDGADSKRRDLLSPLAQGLAAERAIDMARELAR